ncbi:2-dehydro-3-deoxygluconokinase [Micromonospora rhizosphaerae]|uniref:2-dehydro-3-deoxygluconokinase n=1 Tax=Micromonospora rhizosphaerae TaxID=568872 RepID=A0A1C6RT83_9ACTN|nr:sugar kinase [Micromonospora rhizosphaerae]SCL20287.1 2-dehydro-3-deoxygluconokinase [Micromonospora rhizosphaerae]
MTSRTQTANAVAQGLDAVCIGETMLQLTPIDAQPLATRPHLAMHIGGAESNVACTLVALGHRAAWVSRVGDDQFGQLIADELTRRSVDLTMVEVDPDRPTGVYFKDPAPHGTAVHYYRRESAASAMTRDLVDSVPALHRTRLIHVSGITPALSQSCADLVDALLVDRTVRGPLLSFDVNHRPALWSAETAAPALLRLARAADLVFVGRDEAERLWGTATPTQVRALLPHVPTLVVKDAEHGATSYGDGGDVFEPAPQVDVVEPVGAGDAFASGFLSGLLDDCHPASRLRRGHLAAAHTLRTVGDLGELPHRSQLDRLDEGVFRGPRN